MWPWSRRARPKQLLSLGEGVSFLEATVERARTFTPAANIFLIADREIVSAARRFLPALPSQNFIVEPSPRNTWPSCVLGTAVVAHVVAADAPLIVLPADHAVRDEGAFGRALATGAARAQGGAFVTFGISPDRAETGYGYVKRGEVLAAGPPAVSRGLSFHEKPDAERARAYVASGEYVWNSGMFGWRADAFFAAAGATRPHERTLIEGVVQAVRSDDKDGVVAAFEGLERTSVDYALMERIQGFEVVTMDCGWDDVGSFDALGRVVSPDAAGNVILGDVTVVNARGNVVVSAGGRPVVVGGVEDVVVVDGGDVVAVYKRGDGQAVREVFAIIEKVRPELT